jgi:hypothetical protein
MTGRSAWALPAPMPSTAIAIANRTAIRLIELLLYPLLYLILAARILELS